MSHKIPIKQLKKAIKAHKSMTGLSRDKKFKKEYTYLRNHPELSYLTKSLRPLRKSGSITEAFCKEKMSHFKTWNAFSKSDPALAQTVRKRFYHLSHKLIKKNIKQSNEELLAKAAKYKSPGEMIKKFNNEYNYILRRPGLIKEAWKYWKKTYTTSSVGEESCRKILEGLLKTPFEPFNHFYKKLCLDGYSEKLKIAFEYHGQQHYKEVPWFHNHKKKVSNYLKIQQKNDQLTMKICKIRGIKLIIIPYTVKHQDLQKYIETELTKKRIKFISKFIDLSSLDLTPKVLWTLKTCKIEAKKYKTRTDYRNKSGGSYSTALKNGWLNDVCKHMTSFSKPRNYWTKDLFLKTIKDNGWTKVSQLRKHCLGGLHAAYLNGWMKDLKKLGFNPKSKNKRKTYSKKEILKAMNNCETISQFRHKYKGYYSDALKLKMQKEILKNLFVLNPASLYQ